MSKRWTHDTTRELTVAETARALGVTPQHIRAGGIDHLIAPRIELAAGYRYRFYPRDAVLALVAERARVAAANTNLAANVRDRRRT
jgi:hypothetical protein